VAEEIDDTQDDAKAWVGVGTGVGFAFLSCPETAGAGCIVGMSLLGSGMGYLVGEDLFLDDTTVENLGEVANMFAYATPNAEGLISVGITFQPEEGGSMVRFDENTRYLEMNPDFHEDQYVLQVGGKTITLTPAQAILVNAILGGGLLP